MTQAPPSSQETAKLSADPAHMKKGEEVELHKLDSGLRHVIVGLGWDAPEYKDGYAVDIDASAFLLKHDSRVRRDTDFVFYNNLEAAEGAIRHNGDNTTGAGDGDDELIEINLENVPYDIDRIAFSVTIHNATERQQTFGLVKGAFIRIVNKETQKELARFDLSEDASADNAILFGEILRDTTNWRFRAIGQSSSGGLYKIARDYGINVSPM